MTQKFRLSAIAGAIVAASCLVPQSPLAPSPTHAQQILFPGGSQVYQYQYRPHYGGGYENRSARQIYSGYGFGPYEYGAVPMYPSVSPNANVYRRGASSSLFYRGIRSQGRGNRSIFVPNNARVYSPYGFGRF